MKRNLVLTLVVILAMVITANAAVKEGEREISIFGNYINLVAEDDGTEDNLGVGLSIAQFLSDEVQIGLQGMGSWSSDVDYYTVGPTLKYHFMPANDTIPYLGGQIGYANASNTDNVDGWTYGPLGGIKFCVNENASIFIEYQYHLYGGDLDDALSHSNAVLLGMSCKF